MATLTEIIVMELQSEVLFSQLDSKVIEGIAVGNAKYANSSLLKVNNFYFCPDTILVESKNLIYTLLFD